MIDVPGNLDTYFHHYDAAIASLEENVDDMWPMSALEAQVHATLALAVAMTRVADAIEEQKQ